MIAPVPTDKRARQKSARRAKIEAQRRAAKRRQRTRQVIFVAIAAFVIIGSVVLFGIGGTPTTTTTSTSSTTSSTSTTSTSSTLPTTTLPGHHDNQASVDATAVAHGCPANSSQTVNTLTWPTEPALTISKSTTYYAHVLTTAGSIVIRLNQVTAPHAVNSFIFLANHHYFNCVIFHRVIPGFVIQGGDPTGTGTGGPGYSFQDELPKVGSPTYPLYSLAMANSGPNTNGSQFFIVTGPAGEHLGDNYSLFGRVVSGFSAVSTINNDGSAAGVPPSITHRMLSVTISTKA